MAFLAALAASLWTTDPWLLVLLAGPLFTLTLYQRSALSTKVATRDALTDSLTGPRQPPLVPEPPARSARAGRAERRRGLALPRRRRRVQGLQRPVRPPARRPDPRRALAPVRRGPRRRGRLPFRRRRVRPAPGGERGGRIPVGRGPPRAHRPDGVPPRPARDDHRRHRVVPRVRLEPRRAPAGRRRRALLGQAPREEPLVRLQPVGRARLLAQRAHRAGGAPGTPARCGEPHPHRRLEGHLHRRALRGRRQARRGDGARARSRRRDHAAAEARRPPARPRQDRHPGHGAQEARLPAARRAQARPRARRVRALAAGRARHRAGRLLGAPPPRALGRLRLSRRPRRRGHPLRLARDPRRRRLSTR